MEGNQPLRLLPTLEMLADSMEQAGWQCRMHLNCREQHYRGIRLYHRQQRLQEDVLYLLRPEETEFPSDRYSYLCAAEHPGRANHLICPGYPDEEILDQLLEIFSQFQAWEEEIDLLVYQDGSLQELCELGERILEKPVCIHDDWFVMMAMTESYTRIMEPEYLISSTRGFVPRAVVEDFQHDSDYLETYAYHDARIWQQELDQNLYITLYVNLWDGAVYRGRLLAARGNQDFRPRDYLVAEVLAQRAVQLLRRKKPGGDTIHQNMDDVIFALLRGAQTEPLDFAHLLHLLHWKKTDRFICIRLKPQQRPEGPMLEHVLHSELFHIFPEGYILLGEQEQCVVLNISRSSVFVPWLSHMLSPLCREFCLYAGISSPVTGIRELQAAYHQAGAALEQTFLLRNEKWILRFSECAMDHMLRLLPPPITAGHLVSPALRTLRQWDQAQGTQFFETLRVYLMNERSIPKTAKALIIHRTTLLYRLEKIRSLVTADLEDPWSRMYLLFSLWILEKEEKDRLQAPASAET